MLEAPRRAVDRRLRRRPRRARFHYPLGRALLRRPDPNWEGGGGARRREILSGAPTRRIHLDGRAGKDGSMGRPDERLDGTACRPSRGSRQSARGPPQRRARKRFRATLLPRATAHGKSRGIAGWRSAARAAGPAPPGRRSPDRARREGGLVAGARGCGRKELGRGRARRRGSVRPARRSPRICTALDRDRRGLAEAGTRRGHARPLDSTRGGGDRSALL